MDNPIKYSDLVKPDNAITDLIKQLSELTKAYEDAINKVKGNAESLAGSLKNVNGATQQGREATKQAATETEKLAQQQKKLEEAQNGTHKEMMRLKQATKEANDIAKLELKLAQSKEGSYNKLSAQYSLNKIRLNAMSEAERHATEEGKKLERETNAIYEQMKKLQEATGKHQLNVGNYYQGMNQAMANYSQQIQTSIVGNNQLLQSFVSLGGTMNGTTTILGGVKSGLGALWSSLSGMLTNPAFLAVLGIGAVGMGFKWWYDYNSGLQEATKLTQEFTGLTGDAMVDLRSEILAVADTWGKDFKETLQAVDALSANFGISFEEAMKVVKDGFVAGADVNGDFLNKIKQYPAYFKEAGVSADKFVAIVTQTKSGIFGDQGLDAIKQANARLREMTSETAASLDAIGISSQQVTEDLTNGTRDTFDVLQEVSAKLSELPPASQEVGNVLVDVFGKQGRDAGLEMIKSLQDINTNLDEVKAGTGELGKLQEEQANAEKELQVALATLFDATGGSFESLKAGVSIFIKKGITQLIKGFIKVYNWVIDFYNESLALRLAWAGIVAAFKNAFDTIGNIFNMFMDTLKGFAKTIKGVFTLDWDLIKEGFSQFTTALPKMFAQTAKDYVDNTESAFRDAGKKKSKITMNVEADMKVHANEPVVEGDGKELFEQTNLSGKGKTSRKATGSSSSSRPTSTRSSSSTSSQRTSSARSNNSEAKDVEKRAKEAQKARQKAHDEAVRRAEKQAQEELKAQRAKEDSELALWADGYAKQKRQTELQYQRQLEDLEVQTQKLKAKGELTTQAQQDIADRIVNIEKKRDAELAQLKEKATEDSLKAEKERMELELETIEGAGEKAFQLRRNIIEQERELALMEDSKKDPDKQMGADLINQSFDKKLQDLNSVYEQFYQTKYDQEAELAQSEFDLLENSEYEKTKFALKAERDRLKKQLELNEKYGGQLTKLQQMTIQNQIAKIDKEIEKGDGQDIYDKLGINLTEEKKEAISESMQYAQEALDTFMNSYVQMAEAKEALANKQVESAKSTLEAEIEARNQGYASDVVGAQKELALAKKTQEKAQKQAERAQKAQQAIQAAQQVGNLVTATSKILSEFGMPWAVPFIAAMWGTFAYAKIKAMTAVKGNSETYGEGTVELLEGGSHQSGNDVDLGTKRDGTKRRAEGGEFFAVINKRNSRRFRKYIPKVIHSLNDGTFADKYLNAYRTDDGLVFNVNQSSEELKSLSSDVKAIRKANERKTYIDANGNMVEVYRNVKRTTRR